VYPHSERDAIQPKPHTQNKLQAPPIAMINGAALATLTRQKGVQVFFLPLSQIQPETDNANHREKEIPEEFQEFKDVFSKVKADKLSEHRPYDHRIPLEEGKFPLYGPIYNLSQTELEALRKYIDDNLTKRFIRHSQSPCGAPILFAKKADGSLRLCVNYRGLNKLTIKNRYPLLLISKIMERIGRAKYFTKFDVKDGYNFGRGVENSLLLLLWTFRISCNALRVMQCPWDLPTLYQ